MNYKELIFNLKKLPIDFKPRVIGKTKFKRKIIAVERLVNKSYPTAIFVSGVHARENITSDLLLEMIKNGVFNNIDKFNISFIVMANPDGVDLCELGAKAFPKNYQKKLMQMNHGNLDFSMWKANAFGVDINNNFDANFGTNVNSTQAGSHGYVGAFAESENETKAIVRYINKIKPFISISYHSKGEEIYFNFFQEGVRLKRDKIIAEKFAESTGYKIKNVEAVSSGGFKDWCVQKLKIPALTIEVGSDDLAHPIKKENLKEIYDKNKNVASDLNFAYNVFEKYQKSIT